LVPNELQQVLSHLEVRQAQDVDGVCAEMLKIWGDELPKCWVQIFSSMLHSGYFEPTCLVHDVTESRKQHTTEQLETHCNIENQLHVPEITIWKIKRDIRNGTML
jgi:hypothetical protein